MAKNGREIVTGEQLNVIVGSEKQYEISEAVKLNILEILNERYQITEDDFNISELSFVPSLKVKDLGFDRSMILGYGQDDKVCAYATLRAFIDKEPKKTSVIIFSDKEETGSLGNTGMESKIFDTFLNNVLNKLGINEIGLLDNIYMKSNMISADVDGAYDPNFASVFESENTAYINCGLAIAKYTGSGGKYNASDANAEYVSKLIKVFEKENISYQFSDLGVIDQGGGGTIAYIMANKGVNVIDCGIAILSMHAPRRNCK